MNFMTYIQGAAMALSLLLVAAVAVAAGPSYRIEVDGLACPFCAYGIEKKLSALAGVERLETNLKEGSVLVIMQEGTTLDPASVRRAVKEAGFTLKGFEAINAGGGQ